MAESSNGASSAWRRGARILRTLLTLVAVVFVVFAARSLAERWDSEAVHIDPLYLVLSLVPLELGALIVAFGWKLLLERMTGRAVSLRAALSTHLESQLARYMPGKVGVPVMRAAAAPELGAGAGLIVSSTFIEALSMIAVGGATGFFCVVLAAGDRQSAASAIGGVWGLLALGVFLAATLVLLVLNRRAYPRFVRRLLGDHGTGPVVPVLVPLCHAAYWLCWALHGALVCLSVGASSAAATAGAGLFILAPLAGIIAVATPSGIGVREAVLSVGLAVSLGPAPALAATLASRGISLVGDILAWAYARFVLRRSPRG